MAAIPLRLHRRDLISVTRTGPAGKNAAFVISMLTHIIRLPPISEENRDDGSYALVLVPTRDLALKIKAETMNLVHSMGIKMVWVVGGQSIEAERFNIMQGCEVVIATPGRLLGLQKEGYVVLNQCSYVVVNEVDVIIDMGFEPQVMGVLDAIPSSNLKPENKDEELDENKVYRTTCVFSTSMFPSLERLARKYLRNPLVEVSDLMKQHVIMVKESEKLSRLHTVLEQLGDKTAIVFVNSRTATDTFAKNLDEKGYRTTTIQGKKSREHQEISLKGFKTKRYNVMVATDAAGSEIDTLDSAYVINYHMPGNTATYKDRIGLNRRVRKIGVATTFLTLLDMDLFYDLKQVLIQSNSVVPSELARHVTYKFKPGSGPRPRQRDDTVYATNKHLMNLQ